MYHNLQSSLCRSLSAVQLKVMLYSHMSLHVICMQSHDDNGCTHLLLYKSILFADVGCMFNLVCCKCSSCTRSSACSSFSPYRVRPGCPSLQYLPAAADCLSYHVCFSPPLSYHFSPHLPVLCWYHALFAVLQGTPQTSRYAAMYLLCIMLSWQLIQACSIFIDSYCLD